MHSYPKYSRQMTGIIMDCTNARHNEQVISAAQGDLARRHALWKWICSLCPAANLPVAPREGRLLPRVSWLVGVSKVEKYNYNVLSVIRCLFLQSRPLQNLRRNTIAWAPNMALFSLARRQSLVWSPEQSYVWTLKISQGLSRAAVNGI